MVNGKWIDVHEMNIYNMSLLSLFLFVLFIVWIKAYCFFNVRIRLSTAKVFADNTTPE